MRKTKEDTEISKLRILLAAEEEFCQRGFAAANIDTIAKAAGLTKGAIFWHYKSKAELFKEIMKRAIGRVKMIFRETFSSSRPIMEKCKEVIKKVKKDKAFEVLLLLSNAQNTGDIPKEVLVECNKEISEIFKDAFQYFNEAKKRGELRADTDVRHILVPTTLIMSGFAKINEWKSMLAPIGSHIDDDAVIDVIFKGLSSFQKK
jgi:AcrR family transcriptional regulator